MANFREYRVWQSAHALALQLYGVTGDFPQAERYDLVRQIRRAGASIPANLAEGLGKAGDRERGRFINISIGSAYELDYHLQLGLDLGYLRGDQHAPLMKALISIRRRLVVLHQRLVADRR